MAKSDLQTYTRTDVDNARTKGQIIGWIQGAGLVLVASLVFQLAGWIPTVLVAGVIGFVAYKVFTR